MCVSALHCTLYHALTPVQQIELNEYLIKGNAIMSQRKTWTWKHSQYQGEREKLLSVLQGKVFQLESIYLVFISCVYFNGVRFCFLYRYDKVFPFLVVFVFAYFFRITSLSF